MLKSITFSFSTFKLTTIAIIFYCGNLIGQVQGDSVHVESTYAKKYIGKISNLDKEGLFIKVSNSREIYLPKFEIKSILVIPKLVKPEAIAEVAPLSVDSSEVKTNTDNLKQVNPARDSLEKPETIEKQNKTSEKLDDKSNFATVYFSRPFKKAFGKRTILYHNEKTIGFLTGYRYIEYKCLPGEHVFWQNAGLFRKDFIKANLLENKVYFIECGHNQALPIYGISTRLKKHLKFIRKNNPKLTTEDHREKLDISYRRSKRNGIKKYNKLLENDGRGMSSLSENMYFDSSAHDYPFMKKEFIKNYNNKEKYNVFIGAWTGINQMQSTLGGYNYIRLNSMNPLGINSEFRLKNKQNKPFLGVELSSFWYSQQLNNYWFLWGSSNSRIKTHSIIVNMKVYYEFRRAIIFYGYGLGNCEEKFISDQSSSVHNFLTVGNSIGSYFWLNKMFQFHFEIKTFSSVTNAQPGYNRYNRQFGLNFGLKYQIK